jgi:hypothetical protein
MVQVDLALNHMHFGTIGGTRIDAKYRPAIHRAPTYGSQREALRHQWYVRGDQTAANSAP